MPVTWRFQHSVLILGFIGNYDFADVRAAVDEAFADAAFRPGTSLLMDARSSLIYLSTDEAVRRARWFTSLRDRGVSSRWALLLRPYPLQMLETAVACFREVGVDAQVFSDPDAAMEWLVADDTIWMGWSPSPSKQPTETTAT
jgi:hypothetical protein